MPKSTPSNPQNHIKDIRRKKGLRQADLSEKTQIPVVTIARYESAKYGGSIRAEIQQKIADALGEERETVFPQNTNDIRTVSRRQILGNFGTIGAGIGLASFGASAFGDAFGLQRNRQSLSAEEVQALADDNYASWELFNTLQIGSSLDYTMAIAQGKIVTLEHLAKCSLIGKQKETMLLLLGDIHLLVGRISRENKNFGEAERHFSRAMEIGQEIDNADLKTAARDYFGSLLIDQELYITALNNGTATLKDAEGASYPIWAEGQITAGYALAYTGQYSEAQRLAYNARNRRPGPDPDIWVGHLTNPDIVHKQFEVLSKIAAEKNYDAVRASEESLKDLDREQPHNLQFRARLQIFQATALWQLGSVDDAAIVTKESLRNTTLIGSVLNHQRIEKLYLQMQRSPHRKRQDIKELGELVAAERP